MEYDPSAQQLTVYGPLHARLAMQALGVTPGPDDQPNSPDFAHVVKRDDLSHIVEALDRTYLRDTYGQRDLADVVRFGDTLLYIVIHGHLASE